MVRKGFALRTGDAAGFVEQSRVLPVVHTASALPVDIVLAGPGLEELFLGRRQEHQREATRIPVASPEDLVVMKLLAGRPRDIEDVRAVLRAMGSRLDFTLVRATLALLEEALGQSDLLPRLAELRREVSQRRANAPAAPVRDPSATVPHAVLGRRGEDRTDDKGRCVAEGANALAVCFDAPIAAAKNSRSLAKRIARNLDNAPHTLLLSALQIAKIPWRTRLNHLGGAPPRLSTAGTVRVAMWCAEQVRALAAPEEVVAIDARLADARALLASPDLARSRSADLAHRPHFPRRPIAVAQDVVEAAIMAVCRPGTIRKPARDAITTAIRLVRDRSWESRREMSEMRRFCDGLDRELMRLEAETVLATRLQLELEIEDVLWRAPPANFIAPEPTFIVRLGPYAYGLFTKLGNRYSWNTGPRDEVLATVPDAWMESAVAALMPPSG